MHDASISSKILVMVTRHNAFKFGIGTGLTSHLSVIGYTAVFIKRLAQETYAW